MTKRTSLHLTDTLKRQRPDSTASDTNHVPVPKNSITRSLFDTLSDDSEDDETWPSVDPHINATWTPSTHNVESQQETINQVDIKDDFIFEGNEHEIVTDCENDLDLSFDVRKFITSSQFERQQQEQPEDKQSPEYAPFSLREHVQSAMLSTTKSQSVARLDQSINDVACAAAAADDPFLAFGMPTCELDTVMHDYHDHVALESSNYLTAPRLNTGLRTGTNNCGNTVYFPTRNLNSSILSDKQGPQYNDVIQDAQFIASLRQIEEQVDFEIQTKDKHPSHRDTATHRNEGTSDQLWVDQYHPQSYMDLISNESVARQVLSWVRAWDVCVFKSKLKKRKLQPEIQQKHDLSKPSQTSRYQVSKPSHQMKKPITKSNLAPYPSLIEIELTPNDTLHRPLRRILLLSGPPGLGKSTMVQVIAKQAGYDVTEINASDDRTSRTVTEKLNCAMSSATISNGKLSRRPRLVVMDEIDGAATVGSEGSTLIKLLLQVASTCRRPIVCICNDPYAPVLRPLRLASELVTMYRPNTHDALIRRLAGICLRENIRVSRQSLHWLSESAQGDIRSSIHALQFVSRQNMDDTDADSQLNWKCKNTEFVAPKPVLITKEMLQKAQLATKDAGPGGGMPFIWDAMFSTQTAQKLANDMGTPNMPLSSLASAIDRYGEFEKVAVGCLEYAVLVDTPEFASVAGALHQLSLVDVMMAARYRPGGLGHSTDSAIPWALASVHSYFQGGLAAVTSTNPWSRLAKSGGKLEYPKVDYEAYLRKRDFSNTLTSFRHAVVPQSAASIVTMTSLALATDILGGGLLAQIISPKIQHANYRIMPERERGRILRLVEVLSGLGVRLLPMPDLTLRLEPPLELLCGLTLGRRKLQMLLPKNQAVRQLLSAELKSATISPVSSRMSEKAVPSNSTVLKDFFGRPKVLAEVPFTSSQTLKLKISRITFKFHEGYSNAVRRPVYVKDLL